MATCAYYYAEIGTAKALIVPHMKDGEFVAIVADTLRSAEDPRSTTTTKAKTLSAAKQKVERLLREGPFKNSQLIRARKGKRLLGAGDWLCGTRG